MLYKLSYYGLSGIALNIFKNYLYNRTQYAEFRNNHSTFSTIKIGVPQGSILGPLIFIIYINDIIKASNAIKFIMYADDTTLFSTINCKGNVIRQNLCFNNELSKISDWLLVNKLSHNVAKTQFMVFSMPQNKIILPSLNIADTEIECVDSFNFLGITFDKHINWQAHINKTVGKIYRTTGILHRLKYVLPRYILKTIYTSLILCHINYGILAWGDNNNIIFKIQKRAIRTITCSKCIAHTEPLFKDLRLLKVFDIYKLQQLQFYYKLYNRLLPS